MNRVEKHDNFNINNILISNLHVPYSLPNALEKPQWRQYLNQGGGQRCLNVTNARATYC